MDEVFPMAHGIARTRIVGRHGIGRAGSRQACATEDERQGENGTRETPPDRPSAHRDRLSEAEGQGASGTHPHAFASGLYRSDFDLKVT
jgi:hypothetical protein